MRFADLVILAWVPFGVMLFAFLRPRHAVLAAYLGAWLFLPMKAGLVINILPDIDKVTAASLSVLLGVAIFDAGRLFTFRLRWFDLPIIAWCLAPFASSYFNGLGAWDGASGILEQLTLYGIPYLIGRCYFNDYDGFRELAIAIFLGGLIYVPLCLYEIKMSPQLHKIFYGYYQHGFNQTYRFGGYRPMVFMQHGLAVGFWMTAASLIGVWLMATGALRQVFGVPMIVCVPVMIVTTVLCKSAAGIGFLAMGVAVLFAIKWSRTAIPLYLLIAFAPAYMVLRTTGVVSGQYAVEVATEIFGADRAQSLAYRMDAENVYTQHALKKPLWGHGRWNPDNPRRPPWMVYNEETGKREAIVDGMWLLTFAVNGLFGLVTLTATVLLPPLLLRNRIPPRWWAHPMAAPAVACAVMIALHMADNMLNAMINPVFICAIGGLAVLGTRQAAAAATAPAGYGYANGGGRPSPAQAYGAPVAQPIHPRRRPIMPPPPNPPIPASSATPSSR